LLAKWEARLGVRATQIKVYRAKSAWGRCAYSCGRITLSSRLAQRPIECLDYVVLHELAHLIENDHSERFWALLDQHLPEWPSVRATLNDL
jgi:predicted metal-dependent hydrolase